MCINKLLCIYGFLVVSLFHLLKRGDQTSKQKIIKTTFSTGPRPKQYDGTKDRKKLIRHFQA
jgi:hypothetical protein